MTPPLRKLVVGVALVEAREPALDGALALADAIGLELVAVHAAPPGLATTGPFGSGWVDPRRRQLLRDAAAARLSARCAGYLGDHRRLELRTEVGAPAPTIAAVCREVGGDLIVVGGRPRSIDADASEWGSTSDRVLRLSPVPVLAVRGATTRPPRHIAAAVDLSVPSADALRFALRLERQLATATDHSSPITAVFCYPPEAAGSPERAEGAVKSFVRRAVGSGWRRVQRWVVPGDPRRELPRLFVELGADLLVLGSNGLGGFARHLPGKVATAVFATAPGDVVVVPPDATAG